MIDANSTHSSTTASSLNSSSREAEWTVMVYMAGDNNLSDNMAFSLNDLDTFAQSARRDQEKKVNLLAYFDSSCPTVATQYIDFSNGAAEREEVANTIPAYPKAAAGRKRRDPEDSASAYSILNFIHWCLNTRGRRASNYAIIFSGHSFGFYGSSLMGDESSGRYLTLRRLRWALEEAAADQLSGDDKRFAIVGFDSCEMGMLEVGYELAKVAKTMITSEGNLPNSGWGYGPMLKHFIDDPQGFLNVTQANAFADVDLSAPENVSNAAEGFVRGFITQQTAYAIGGRSVDIAAWDLDAVGSVAGSVGELGESLLAGLRVDKLESDEKLTMSETLDFELLRSAILRSRSSCQTYMHEQSVDVKDLCQYLMIECRQLEKQSAARGSNIFTEIAARCQSVIDACDACILGAGFVGDAYQFSNGISLYFPWTALTYQSTAQVYLWLRFVRGSARTQVRPLGAGWDKFLYYYLHFLTLRRTRLTADDVLDTLAGINDGKILSADWENFRENFRLGKGDMPNAPLDDNGSPGRENWRLGTRENWLIGTREDWRSGTRENWRLGTRESLASNMSLFDRIRNFQLDWSVAGLLNDDDGNVDPISLRDGSGFEAKRSTGKRP